MNYTVTRSLTFSMQPYEVAKSEATITFEDSEVPEGVTPEGFADEVLNRLTSVELTEIRAATNNSESFIHYYRPNLSEGN